MTQVLNLLSTFVTILDAVPATGFAGQPMSQLSTGEGAPAYLKTQEDVTAWTANLGSAVANYARLIRLPSDAIIKKLEVASDAPLDSNAVQTLKLNFGIAFSDATQDGTPATYQTLIPTSTKNGTTTTFTAYSSPNDMFGSITLSGNNAKIPLTDITLNGTTATYPWATLLFTPLIELFGFTTGQGFNIEQIGYIDIYGYVAVAAATPAAGNLLIKATFCDE